MRLELRPFSDTAAGPVLSIQVEIGRPAPAILSLRYSLAGAIARLAIPPPAQPERTDELWRHTCFEAFLQAQNPSGSGEPYVELNLAPSTQWAAYSFTGYREGMAPAPIATPRIDLVQTDATLDLAVQLNLAGLSLPPGPCRLALSAVIEDAAGAKSYWALAHAPGRPDFHHRSSFACQLPDAA
jgi:hypothetical protein